VLTCTLPASAIPAFARRYETSCSTCHVQFPNLNPFGEAFRRNGYQFPAGADTDSIKQKPMPLVTEGRRDLFPRSDWPTDLGSYPPVAVILNGIVPIFPDARTRPGGEKAVSFGDMFGEASLLLGARAGDHVAVFAGVNVMSNAPVQFERGFIVFSNLVPWSLLNVRIGQFEPQIASFSSYRRIAGPTYLILNAALEPSYFSLEPYVRGVNLSGTIGGRVGWDAAWVQGVEAANYAAEETSQMPRDGYAHVYTRLGGMRLDGEEPTGEAPGAGALDDPSLDVGVFGYVGKHDVEVDETGDAPPQGDLAAKVGGDTLARFGTMSVLFATAYERHRYDLIAPRSRLQGLGEVTWRVFPWLACAVRAEAEVGSAGTMRRLVPIVNAHPRINLKLQAYAIVGSPTLGLPGTRVTEIDLGATYAF
jgi:hypothetical protein